MLFALFASTCKINLYVCIHNLRTRDLENSNQKCIYLLLYTMKTNGFGCLTKLFSEAINVNNIFYMEYLSSITYLFLPFLYAIRAESQLNFRFVYTAHEKLSACPHHTRHLCMNVEFVKVALLYKVINRLRRSVGIKYFITRQ